MLKKRLMVSSGNAAYKFTLLLPLAVSVGAVCPFDMNSAIAISMVAAVAYVITPTVSLFPFYLNLLISMYLYNMVGLTGAVICFNLVAIISFFTLRSKWLLALMNAPELISSLMLSTAFTMTILFTTNYFGIGATGNTVIEMIKSYVSLGFHGNWRGVLYGTIVMVIMITYPRRFKLLSKKISATFVAIFTVYILNFALIPPGKISPIELIEKQAFSLNWTFSTNGLSSFKTIFVMIICTIAMSLVICMTGKRDTSEIQDSLFDTSAMVLCARLGGIFTGKVSLHLWGILEGITVAGLLALILIPTGGLMRMPVAATAVVLIVGGWQSVEWGLIRKALRSRRSMLIFAVTVIFSVLFNMAVGVIVGSALNILLNSVKLKKIYKKKVA